MNDTEKIEALTDKLIEAERIIDEAHTELYSTKDEIDSEGMCAYDVLNDYKPFNLYPL